MAADLGVSDNKARAAPRVGVRLDFSCACDACLRLLSWHVISSSPPLLTADRHRRATLPNPAASAADARDAPACSGAPLPLPFAQVFAAEEARAFYRELEQRQAAEEAQAAAGGAGAAGVGGTDGGGEGDQALLLAEAGRAAGAAKLLPAAAAAAVAAAAAIGGGGGQAKKLG